MYPVIAFTRITLHFVSALVILGFGPGPAFCPLSDSGKGALGGATPSAFRGGSKSRGLWLLSLLSLRPTSDLIAGARVQSV